MVRRYLYSTENRSPVTILPSPFNITIASTSYDIITYLLTNGRTPPLANRDHQHNKATIKRSHLFLWRDTLFSTET